jgi:hypothetical protein
MRSIIVALRMDASDETRRNLARRGRSIGAMFFAFFGGAWLAVWNHLAGPRPLAGYAVIAPLAAALFLFARNRFRRYDAAAVGRIETPESRRRDRWFHIINAGQWVLIMIVANVLVNVGLGAWVLSSVVLIVGLHFLPLARLFDYSAHYVTGCSFILLALIVPRIAAGGPGDPIICLGAGLMLWASALWGLLAA